MSNIDIIKPSYDVLNTVSLTVRGFSELVDLMPDDIEHSAILRILSDKLETDLSSLRGQLEILWKLASELPSGVSDMTASNNPT